MKIEFTPHHAVADIFPPEPIKKYIPEWYKKLPGHIPFKDPHDIVNLGAKKDVKRCVPVLDYMTSGYVIRAQCDIVLTRDLDPKDKTCERIRSYAHMQEKFGLELIGGHGNSQFPIEVRGVKKQTLKFNNYYHIKTPPGYSCMFYQPFYLLESCFTVLPGIVDTDKHTECINFPFFLQDQPDEEFRIDIKAGDPLVCVLPYKRDNWSSKFNPSERNENGDQLVPVSKARLKFNAIMDYAYKNLFHSKKRFD